MRDDSLAVFKYLITKSMIAVVVGIDCVNDREISELSDFFQYFSGFRWSGSSVNNYDPFRCYNNGGVRIYSFAIDDGINIFQNLDGFHFTGEARGRETDKESEYCDYCQGSRF